ncbi:DUF6194 family protein [Nocardia sp. CDC159]|uniref:DUF6194 family protein n=1 Tax=Nocardia pulmonis TaxID=2951408 RepID=A0A9X2E4R9_9NOCA|nr:MULTISPECIES: DUF6194 family protein [Nocardia]MCM6773601.1 DUF6194 family protein [Nocardia pulmonis]MCM6786488.1 DUF6194 family protein [Nocardia sp. CDC159]
MNADDMKRHIAESYEGIRLLEHLGDTFVIYDPEGDLPPQRQLPFATIVTADNYDTVSALGEPDAYRLNIGLPRPRYTELFGPVPTQRDADGVYDTGYDYAARDRLMPHPIYAVQNWVCVVNPGATTLNTALSLLDEAHAFAVRKHTNRRARAVRR